MAQHLISAAALIESPPQHVYAILADYRNGHPRILPKPHFVSLEVEQGGVGAGTVVNFQMNVMGRTQSFHSAITEPEPGRVLVETELNTGAVTTFTVEPRDGGQHSYVEITTALKVRDGVLGTAEGWLAEQALHPIYVKELKQLATVAAQ